MDESDIEVAAELTADGTGIAQYLLIDGAVCCTNSCGQLMMILIEDDEIAEATVAYLRRIGAREYPSFGSYAKRCSTE
jgi:hypothetical protein